MISFLAVLIFDLGDFKESVRFLLLACWRAFMAFLPWAGRELMADIDVFTIFKPCLSYLAQVESTTTIVLALVLSLFTIMFHRDRNSLTSVHVVVVVVVDVGFDVHVGVVIDTTQRMLHLFTDRGPSWRIFFPSKCSTSVATIISDI